MVGNAGTAQIAVNALVYCAFVRVLVHFVYYYVRARTGTKKGAICPLCLFVSQPINNQSNHPHPKSKQNPNTYAQNPTKIQVEAGYNPSKIQVNVHFVFPTHSAPNPPKAL